MRKDTRDPETQRLSHLTAWDQSLEGDRNLSTQPSWSHIHAFPVSRLIYVVDSDWQAHGNTSSILPEPKFNLSF